MKHTDAAGDLSPERIEYLFAVAERLAGKYQDGMVSLSEMHITMPLTAFSDLLVAATLRAHVDIDELLERSSLGTPEAKALRAQADPQLVEKVIARAKELEREELRPCPKCQLGHILEDSISAFCSRRYAAVFPCDWWVIA